MSVPTNGSVEPTRCPKCGFTSGDDWRQCGGFCPMPGSPHYVAVPRRFTSMGKEVLHPDGSHFADAVTPDAAHMIAVRMNAALDLHP